MLPFEFLNVFDLDAEPFEEASRRSVVLEDVIFEVDGTAFVERTTVVIAPIRLVGAVHRLVRVGVASHTALDQKAEVGGLDDFQQMLEENPVLLFERTMLAEVTNANVGTFADEVGVVGTVGEDARFVWLEVIAENSTQGVGEILGAAPRSTLVGYDRFIILAVEGDAVVDTKKNLRGILGDPLGTFPTTFFIAVEDVEAGDFGLDHLDHEPDPGGAVSAEAVAQFTFLAGDGGDPRSFDLEFLIALVRMHGVSVRGPADVWIITDFDDDVAEIILIEIREVRQKLLDEDFLAQRPCGALEAQHIEQHLIDGGDHWSFLSGYSDQFHGAVKTVALTLPLLSSVRRHWRSGFECRRLSPDWR